MVRRVFLAFLVFGLVACGDNGMEPDSILGTYKSQTLNGEEFGFTFQTFDPSTGIQTITEVTAEDIVLDPQSSCEVNTTLTESVFDQFGLLGEMTRVTERTCTFEFSNGAITLNYTVGGTDTGSIVGKTLTITRGDDVIVYRK